MRLARALDTLLRLAGAAALLALPVALVASSVGSLTTFANGTVADATAVNANFTALKAAVDDNDARLDTLAFSGSDLALGGTLTASAVNTSGTSGSACAMRMFTAGPVDVNYAMPGYTDAQCVWVNNGIIGFNGSGCYYGLDANNEWDQRNLAGHSAIHSACGNSPALLVCCK